MGKLLGYVRGLMCGECEGCVAEPARCLSGGRFYWVLFTQVPH